MFIAIEGCIGAGKTTVAKGLAARRGSSLLLEDFEANPFIRAFYADPVGTAIETEFAFLMLHFHQLKGVAREMVEGAVVTDFHLGKDLLYAELNVTDEPVRRVFGELYELCMERLRTPDVLVFLSASTELIVDRIRRRNRDFELTIDSKYYAAINAAYETLFETHLGTKVRIDMDRWDFVRDPVLFEELDRLVNTELTSRG